MPSVFSQEQSILKKPVAIYLAGGMRSNWQDAVRACIPRGVLWLDPREHGSTDPLVYTAWDLRAVELADIVLGYMEKTNPNGAGLAMEFGYACHCGDKELYYVEDPEFSFGKYFGMVKAVSNQFTNMQAALQQITAAHRIPLDLTPWNTFEQGSDRAPFVTA